MVDPNVSEVDPDAIPKKWRTRTYVTTVVVSALNLGVTGIMAILSPDNIAQIMGIGGVVTSVVAFVCGSFGVAYRPTK